MPSATKSPFFLAALAFLIPSSFLLAQNATKPSPAGELAQLQGTWEGVELGREAEGKCTMTISGTTIHFQGATKDEWYKGTFELPPGTEPKQLRSTIQECPSQEVVGKTAVAIYKIEAGMLTLAGHMPGASDPPKSFDGDTQSRTFNFKRVKPLNDTTEAPASK